MAERVFVPPGTIFGFNPLEIGSTLQKPIHLVLMREGLQWFQSPRNRVNTSKSYHLADLPDCHRGSFQSPRNRVNTSKNQPIFVSGRLQGAGFNPLEIGSTLQKRRRSSTSHSPSTSSFNPLEIGSTLQKRCQIRSPRDRGMWMFQSPRNRVNTSKMSITATSQLLSAVHVSIP